MKLHAPITLGLFALVFGSCTPQAPPARPTPISTPPPESTVVPAVVQSQVHEDGLHVNVQRNGAPAPGVAVALRFESGDRVAGITNEQGNVTLVPSLEQLFANSDFGTASVIAAGELQEVNLTPMIQATAAKHQSEWTELSRAREHRHSRADAAVSFVGPVYRDVSRQPLIEACAPSGAEICGDGIDNDCSGRYDESSCGYHSGVVQFTASWRGDADVDLHAMGPDGAEVWKERPAKAGAQLVMDKSCQPQARGDAGCRSGNVENVYVPASEVPVSGTYQAWLELDTVGATAGNTPIAVMFSGRVGSKSWRTLVKLAPIPGASYQVAIPLGADQDHDSVIDSHDACPTTPGCWFDQVAHRGCADTDEDAVPDSRDACPKLAGLDSEDVEKHGCPLVFGNASVTNDGVRIASRIEFAFGRAELEPTSKRTLADVAQALLALPSKVEQIAIDGHTDEVGSEADNVVLSGDRARAVTAALVALGVPEGKLTARGFGETQPRATNDTARGRQENRRVEFLVLKPRGTVSTCWSLPAVTDAPTPQAQRTP